MKSLKSLAKQGGQGVRIEPEAIQRPVKVVKDFLSSLANPQPSPPSYGTRFYESPYVYRNEGYGYPAESAETFDVNLSPADVALEVEEQEDSDEVPVPVQDPRVSTFCTATSEAMHSLVNPQVLSSPDKLRHTLMDWLQELENLVSLLSSVTTRGEEEVLTTRGEEALTARGEEEALTTRGEEAFTARGEEEALTTQREEEALTTRGEEEALTTRGEEALTKQGEEENLTTQRKEEALATRGEEEALATRGEEEEQRNQEDVMDHTSLTTVDGDRSTDLQSQIGSQKPQKSHSETKNLGGAQLQSHSETENLGGAQLPSEAIHTPADFFQSKLYLGLEDETRETVTELMSLCAELGVHCTTAGSGSLRMFVRRYVSVLDVGRMRSLLGTEEWEMRSVCWRDVARKCTAVLPEDDRVLELISLDVDSAVNHIATNASSLSDQLPAYLIRLVT